MAKRRIIETEEIGIKNLDIECWPMVNISNLSGRNKERFIKRKMSVDLYIKNEITVEEITEITKVNPVELRRYIKRCTSEDPDGILWGYRGLIPNKRIKTYNRITEVTLQGKKTGAFKQLLLNYPKIKDKLEKLYFHNSKSMEPVISTTYLHKQFIGLCRSDGIGLNEYPFTSNDYARRSLQRYLKELECKNMALAARRSSEDAARLATSTGIGEQNAPIIVRPFERVQFDGHRIDAMFSITFYTPEGDMITDVMERVWILTLLDVATRTVLGYHISLNKEYTAADVLRCIKNAVVPKKLRSQFSIPGLKYPENIGYATSLIPETEWAVWDELQFDNGKSNLSTHVREVLKHVIGCSINAGMVRMPERRGIIERFFKTLEANGFQRLPSTTGSHPKDPKRNNPEKKAIDYNITITQLEEVTELIIANYNTSRHEGIGNLSPLEVMQQRIQRGFIINQMPEDQRNQAIFLSLQAVREVKGNIKEGRRPFVHYEGVNYRNDVLARSPHLIGTKLTLVVNTEDLRFIRAFLPDGSDLGLLTANGKWGVSPHTLQIRKLIRKLRNQKLLDFTNMDDPIQKLNEFLRTDAKDKKKARNQFAEMQRYSDQQATSSTSLQINQMEDDLRQTNVAELPITRKLKKTII